MPHADFPYALALSPMAAGVHSPCTSIPHTMATIALSHPIQCQRLAPSTPWFDSPVTRNLTVVLTRGYVILTYTFTRMHLYLLKYLQICFLCPTLSAKNIKVITFLKNILHRFFFLCFLFPFVSMPAGLDCFPSAHTHLHMVLHCPLYP